MICVESLVFGGGYAALGYASAAKDSLLLLEGELPGEDYTGIQRPAAHSGQPVSEQGRVLCAFLKENHVLSGDGRLDMLRGSTALCRYVCDQGIRLLMDASVISVRRAEQGFETIVYTNSGVRHIFAKNLLDTTAARVSDLAAARIVKKRLHLMCHGADKCAPRPAREGVYVQSGFFPGEWNVCFEFSPETSLPQARLAIENCWKDSFSPGEYLINTMGQDFERIAQPNGQGVCPWLPPHAYADPVSAFEAGAALGKAVADR